MNLIMAINEALEKNVSVISKRGYRENRPGPTSNFGTLIGPGKIHPTYLLNNIQFIHQEDLLSNDWAVEEKIYNLTRSQFFNGVAETIKTRMEQRVYDAKMEHFIESAIVDFWNRITNGT